MPVTIDKLTPKQEMFSNLYIALGNASAAYRQAYNAEGMTTATIHVKASELLKNGKVTARVSELNNQNAERHKVTVDSLVSELEQARKAALAAGSANGMVAATMAKARLVGLDKPTLSLPCGITTPPVFNIVGIRAKCDND